MNKLSKSADNYEKRKESETKKNKKILELYIRALIQLIPGAGGAIEKALFANLDATRQQEIEDLLNTLLSSLAEQQQEIVKNSNDIKEIIDAIHIDDEKFSLFIDRLYKVEILGDDLVEKIKRTDIKNEVNYKEIFSRIEILEREAKIERRMFASAKEYFSSNGKHLLDITVTGIERFVEYIEAYKKFISGESSILIISGKGGNGKTHLLKEISNIDCVDFNLLYTNIGLRDLEKAIQDELDIKQKYIIVIDDVDRSLEDLPILVALTKAYSNNIKLILATRPAGLNSITKHLYDAKLIGEYDKIEIEDWKSEELLQLLQILDVKKDKDEQLLIVKMYPNPFLIVWIGRNIKGDTSLSIENIREIFVNDIKRIANENIKHFVDNPINFLIDLAIIIPFHIDDSKLKSIIAERYKTSEQNIDYSIDQLVSNGILRRIGKTIRFYPDMRGDLFLFYHFEDKLYQSYAKTLFEFWFKIFPERVLINIQALSRYFSSDQIITFCSGIINKWIDDASITNGYNRINNLKLISYVAHLVPDDALNLVYTYLEVKQATTEKTDLFKFEPSSDDYGPIFISLSWKYDIRDQLLNLLLLLEENKIGTYDNYKPNTLIRSLVSPLENQPTIIIQTLSLLENWLEDISPVKLLIIQSALNEVLAGSHETSKSYLNVFKMWEEVLIYHEDIVEMREKAFSILARLLEMDDVETNMVALEISKTLGSSKMGRVDLNSIPLKDRIKEEHARIVEIIGSMISTDKPFKLLNKIEDLLLYWFASETSGTQNVERYLLSFPRNSEYIIIKLFTNPENVIIDFEEIKNNAPTNNKWDWMFDNYFFKYKNMTDQFFIKLAEELDDTYNTPALICDYLLNLENEISGLNPWNHPLIITEWIKINYSVFAEIRSTLSLWQQIPTRFKREIDIEFSKRGSAHLRTIANELLSDINAIDIKQLSIFLDTLSVTKIEYDEVYSWLSQLVSSNDKDCLHELAFKLFYIHQLYNEPSKLCELIIKILEPFEEQKLQLLNRLFLSYDLLIKQRKNIDSICLEKLKDICKKYLYELRKIDYRTESILYFCFQENIEDYVNFLIYRFKKERRHYKEFESIPVGGFHKLELIIDTIDKFLVFLEGVRLISSDISYGGMPLSDLNKNVKNLVNKSSGKQFILEHIENLIEHKDFLSSLEYLPYLNDQDKNIEIILVVTSNSISKGYKDDVVKAYSSLFSKTSFGFDVKELNERKVFFHKLSEKVNSGLHKKIIIDQLNKIEQEINWMTRDDDYYTPRG